MDLPPSLLLLGQNANMPLLPVPPFKLVLPASSLLEQVSNIPKSCEVLRDFTTSAFSQSIIHNGSQLF